MCTEAEMPRYKSHKEVYALKIAGFDGSTIVPADTRYAPFIAAKPDWYNRYCGDASDYGYYVVYEDGYCSWSPSAAFEEGYTRI